MEVKCQGREEGNCPWVREFHLSDGTPFYLFAPVLLWLCTSLSFLCLNAFSHIIAFCGLFFGEHSASTMPMDLSDLGGNAASNRACNSANGTGPRYV